MEKQSEVLIVGYNRPEHLKKSLSSLLENAENQNLLVRIWQNGTHSETCKVIKEFQSHPSISEIHWSKENVKLREPTNWLIKNSKADFIGKVDDDCLLPNDWASQLINIHNNILESGYNPGMLGCWRFQDEDFRPDLAEKKIQTFNKIKILRNPWVEGSGFLMPKNLTIELGEIRKNETFTKYCIRAAKRGYINGWVYPFIHQIHMDDPRAKISMIKNQEEFEKYIPLSAINFGAKNIDDWDQQLRKSAITVQEAPYDPKYYGVWRSRIRRKILSFKQILGF